LISYNCLVAIYIWGIVYQHDHISSNLAQHEYEDMLKNHKEDMIHHKPNSLHISCKFLHYFLPNRGMERDKWPKWSLQSNYIPSLQNPFSLNLRFLMCLWMLICVWRGIYFVIYSWSELVSLNKICLVLQLLIKINGKKFYQSLVNSVVIDVEFGREHHNLIPRNCDRGVLKSLDASTELRTTLNWWWKQ
jgi:hypothetical protein